MRNFKINRDTDTSTSERLSGIFHGLVIAMVAALTLASALHVVAGIA